LAPSKNEEKKIKFDLSAQIINHSSDKKSPQQNAAGFFFEGP
jgi:hypothetical protein